VLRGSARFTAAGEEFVAHAGTFVLLEPKEKRVAHAAEADTVIVAVGAESKRFEPSQWEYGFRGWGLASLGRYDEARQAIEDGLGRYPGSSRLLYDLACVEALAGNSDRAIELLRQSIELEPRNAEHARGDSDFDSLRGRPEFESAIAGKPDADGAGP
jgi:tetratricopeptide (TPR) repeat protein